MSLPNLINQAGQSLSGFWAAREKRERAMLGAAGIAVLLGLYYALLIEPPLTGRDQLIKNLPLLRQQAAQLQVLAKTAAALSDKTVPPTTVISAEYLKTALAHHGLSPQNVMLAGPSVKVQFVDCSFADLLKWLDDMQKSARLSVADANIIALSQPGRVNAVLTLLQPGNE